MNSRETALPFAPALGMVNLSMRLETWSNHPEPT